MAKKQQIILLHNNTQFADASQIVKGELVVEHGTGAENVKLHTLDDKNTIATFITEAAVQAKISEVTTDVTDLTAALAAEEAARLAGDNTVRAEFAAEDTAIRGEFAAEDTAIRGEFAAADENLQGQIDEITEAATTLTGRVAANEEKLVTLMGEGDGSVKKALADAKAYTDELANGAVATNTAAIAKLNGDNTTEGSVAKAVKDAVDAEATARANADSALQAAVDKKVESSVYDGKMTDLDAEDAKFNAILAGYTTDSTVKTAVDAKVEKTVYDAKVQELDTAIKANTALIEKLDETYATDAQVAAAVKTEKERAEAAEKDAKTLVEVGTVGGVKVSEVTGADGIRTYKVEGVGLATGDELSGVAQRVTTLEGNDAGKSVRTIANEELAAQLLSGDAEADFKTLQELAAWLEDHPEDAAAMNETIAANTKAITDEVARAKGIESGLDSRLATVEGDYLKSTDKTTLEGKITAEENRAKGVEAELDAAIKTKVAQSDYDAKVQELNNAIQANTALINKLDETYATDTELAGVKTELETAISNAQKKATTTLTTGTTGHVKVTLTSDNSNGKVYTVEGDDIASANALSGLTTRVETAEGKLTTITADENTSGSILKALKDAKAYADAQVSAEATLRENADNALQTNIDAKEDKTVVAGINTRLEAVEGAYVKSVKTTVNGVEKTYTPVDNVLDLSELVIDGGTY